MRVAYSRRNDESKTVLDTNILAMEFIRREFPGVSDRRDVHALLDCTDWARRITRPLKSRLNLAGWSPVPRSMPSRVKEAFERLKQYVFLD